MAEYVDAPGPSGAAPPTAPAETADGPRGAHTAEAAQTPAGSPSPIPAGDPLEPWRDVFQDDPALLKTFTQHFGSEHAAGAVLKDAQTFADQALNPGEKAAIKRLGLANDPVFLGALGRLGREYAGMRQTITEHQRTIARLQAQVAGKPVLHQWAETAAGGGHGDLASEELAVQRQYMAEHNPEERQRLQARLSKIQEALYGHGKGPARSFRAW